MLQFGIGSAVGDGEETPVGFVNEEGYFVDLPPLSDDDLFRIVRIAEKYEETELSVEEIVEAYEKELEEERGVSLGEGKRVYSRILRSLTDESLGPIHFLLQDPQIEEIMVNGVGEPIFVCHRERGMLSTNLFFKSGDYFCEVANRALRSLGRRVDERSLRGHGLLPNRDRISVMVPPYAKRHTLAIRRFSVAPFTVADLVRRGMLSSRQAAFLWMVMESGSANLGVVGNTGAGKTTLLNALLRFVPREARVICVEETPEIRPPQSQVVQLVSTQGLSLRDAISDSLRLRPDRVVIGEVRSDEEVRALVESCLAGQALGTYFTYHAENAQFALRRMVGQGVREDDLEAIDLLVVCRRDVSKGKVRRRVVSIFDREDGKLTDSCESKRMKRLEKRTGSLEKRESFLEGFEGSDEKFFEEASRVH